MEHATINRQTLTLLARIFPDSTIYARVSEPHWKAISDKQHWGNVVPVFEPVVLAEKGNKWRWIVKLLTECKRSFLILRHAQRTKAAFIFFASNSPVGNLFISLMLRFLFRKCRVVITLHGELKLLRQGGGKTVDRLYSSLLRMAFAMRLRGRRYLVLEEYIRDRMVMHKLLPADSMMAIRHPLTYEGETRHHGIGPRIVFGHLGVAKLEKQSPLFFELAARFRSEIAAGRASFVVAGQLLEEMLPFRNAWVEYSDGDQFVAYDAYLDRCMEMQYAVFFYGSKEYELISSGAIMDAISFGTPIIALRNHYFTHLFAACEIPPGILCSDFDELCNVVDELIATSASNTQSDKNADSVRPLRADYFRMKAGMELLKRKFDLGQIEVDLATQLNEFLS
ncbi:hypothetical protein [Parapedobacter soli]|uniref:hypothetical protein n=1 Tax=Parapedobacter soli TaxID=416955 RepID=UPI0021C804A1|nr:hypothetical protein [Parapedobacter soli]